MKTKASYILLTVVSLVATVGDARAGLMGTAFTYQGRLEDPPGTPVTATCDFQFSLWDSLSAPTGQRPVHGARQLP